MAVTSAAVLADDEYEDGPPVDETEGGDVATEAASTARPPPEAGEAVVIWVSSVGAQAAQSWAKAGSGCIAAIPLPQLAHCTAVGQREMAPIIGRRPDYVPLRSRNFRHLGEGLCFGQR